MTKVKIISENKKLNEKTFLTIILVDTDIISEIITQIYEDNKDNIININYETETNLLTIKTKEKCIIKITEYKDKEIINYSNEILNEIKKINDYNPSLPPENESSISLKRIIILSQIKRKQLEDSLMILYRSPYYLESNISKNNIILKNNNIPIAKIVSNNMIILSNEHKYTLLHIGREITEICSRHQDFFEDDYKEIKCINSEFIIEITPNNIIIKKDNNPFFINYSIRNQSLEIEESNYLTLDVLEKLENEDLLNKIFIYPKKCPIWLQEMLKEENEEMERIIYQIKQKIEENKKIEDKTNLVSFYELLSYQRNKRIFNSKCHENNNDNSLSKGFYIETYLDFPLKTHLIYVVDSSKEYIIEIYYDNLNQLTYKARKIEDERFLELVKPYLKEILDNTYCKKSSLNHEYATLWKDKEYEKQKKEFINNIIDINEITKEKNTNIDDFISLEEIVEILNKIKIYTNNDINPALEIKRKSINSNIEISIEYKIIKILYNYVTDLNKKETFGVTISWNGSFNHNIDGYTFFPYYEEERKQLFSQIYFLKEDLPEWIIKEKNIEKKEVQKNKSNRLFNFFGG